MNWLKTILKILVSVLAIYFVFSTIEFAGVWGYIKEASYGMLLCALAVYVLSQYLSACRMGTLLAKAPIRIPHVENVKLYWLGMFYNFFLPGGVGGDGYKVYYLKKHYKAHVKSMIWLMLIDRLSGLLAICIYILIMASFIINTQIIPLQGYLFLLIPVALAAYYLFIYYTRRQFCAVYWRLTLLSLVIQFLQMTSAAFIFAAMSGIDNELVYSVNKYMFLFFVSSIASAVPISISGVGLREATFVYGCSLLGIDSSIAVALSMVFYVTSLVAALPGGGFILSKKLAKDK